MKKYLYIPLFLIVLGCKTTSKNEPLPDVDVSGEYQGIINMRDFIGVPNPNDYKISKDALKVSVVKNGENLILHGFDTIDLTVPVSEQKAYRNPVNENTPKVLSAFVSFAGDSLVINGNWRYTYVEGEYDSSSINTRNFSFVGFKK